MDDRGLGILHKEYHEASYARTGGPFQMAQLWVNLPKAHKMDAPRYQAIVAAQIAVFALPHDAGTVRVIAGDYAGVTGPAKTFTPVNMFDMTLRANAALDVPIPARHNAAILVMKGAITVNGRAAKLHDFVVLGRRGERVHVTAAAKTQLLVLSGEPIDEPVVQYGPFVMNTEREIAEAVTDFQRGKFGHLDD